MQPFIDRDDMDFNRRMAADAEGRKRMERERQYKEDPLFNRKELKKFLLDLSVNQTLTSTKTFSLPETLKVESDATGYFIDVFKKSWRTVLSRLEPRRIYSKSFSKLYAAQQNNTLSVSLVEINVSADPYKSELNNLLANYIPDFRLDRMFEVISDKSRYPLFYIMIDDKKQMITCDVIDNTTLPETSPLATAAGGKLKRKEGWISLGRKISLKDGSTRILYANKAKPGEFRIKRMVSRNGKKVASFVKPNVR